MPGRVCAARTDCPPGKATHTAGCGIARLYNSEQRQAGAPGRAGAGGPPARAPAATAPRARRARRGAPPLRPPAPP